MKKILLCFLLFSSILEARNLDDLLLLLEKNSYEKEKEQIQENILKGKEAYLKKKDFQEGLGLEATYQERHRETYDNEYLGRVEAQYGPFFATVSKKNGQEKEDVALGLQKSLKDLWYSQNDSAKLQLAWERERQRAVQHQKMQEKKIKLITWYRDYQNHLEEKKWKEELLKSLALEEKKLAKAYSLGSIRRLDWESAKVQLESLEAELLHLEKQLKQAEQVLEQEFRISPQGDLESLSLAGRTANLNLENYGREAIEEQLSEIAIQKEKIKYLDFQQKVPEVNLRYEHLFRGENRKQEDVIQLQVRKQFFQDSYEEDLEKYRLEDLELELVERQKQLDLEKEERRIQYENYESAWEIAEKKEAFAKSKYDVRALEYQLGKISYLEVMEALEDYMEMKTAAQRAKNQLAAFLYEMRLRSKQ